MPTVVNVLVRRAVEDDLDAILSVGHRTWPPTYEPIAGADYVAMGLAKWWTEDATIPAIRAGRVTVAELDGEVVGLASVGPHQSHLVLWKLYVLPEHQGRGIGSALFDSVVARARGHYSQIRATYLEGNKSAQTFYRRKGFVEVDRESGCEGIPDSVWMELVLTPGDTP